jgi:hypothetical protein
MWKAIKYEFALLAIMLALPKGASGQMGDYPVFALGIEAGFFQPTGEWANHPYAAGIDWFGRGTIFRAEFEIKARRMGIAFNGGYTQLDLRAWEDYAKARGDMLDAGAAIAFGGAVLKFYLIDGKPNSFHLELGLNYLAPTGYERFAFRTYDYDFLKARLGFAAGLGYTHFLNAHTAITLRAGGLFAPSGIEYLDGEKHALSGLPLMLGLRFEN